VTDNGGATAVDNITVIVNPAANQAPTANAGSDITLTLPTNSTSLTGSGADAMEPSPVMHGHVSAVLQPLHWNG